jgi:hypothetical protein
MNRFSGSSAAAALAASLAFAAPVSAAVYNVNIAVTPSAPSTFNVGGTNESLTFIDGFTTFTPITLSVGDTLNYNINFPGAVILPTPSVVDSINHLTFFELGITTLPLPSDGPSISGTGSLVLDGLSGPATQGAVVTYGDFALGAGASITVTPFLESYTDNFNTSPGQISITGAHGSFTLTGIDNSFNDVFGDGSVITGGGNYSSLTFDSLSLDSGYIFPTPAPTGGVPEPATWAMLLLGFFGLGATLRLSRRATFA